MKLNTILIVLAVGLSIVLIGLLSFLQIRKQALSKNTDRVDSAMESGASEPFTPPPQLLTEAQKNPNAAIEGVRSPTPVPENIVTLTARGIEPPTIDINGSIFTVLNRFENDVHLYVKRLSDGAIIDMGIVKANSKSTVTIKQEDIILAPRFALIVARENQKIEEVEPVMQANLLLNL